MTPSRPLLIYGTLLALTLMLSATVQAQQSCTHNYTLTVQVEDQCISSSQDRYVSCTDFTTYLEGFNSLLNGSDCLNLVLEPGLYEFKSGGLIAYDIYISSTVYQNVEISCSAVDQFVSSSLRFIKDRNALRLGFVSLEGIVFVGCNKPLQFDELEFLSIKNCSFR